ncbi:hypothetical protein BJI48_01700 [Helicobacter sp. 11S02596-1]|nr:hypothetical protein BJI48_01700 [Helicobacter sp. 11S02596-1]
MGFYLASYPPPPKTSLGGRVKFSDFSQHTSSDKGKQFKISNLRKRVDEEVKRPHNPILWERTGALPPKSGLQIQFKELN